MSNPMQGFDPKWTSPEHYIIGITREIWRIATLRPCTTITRPICRCARRAG